MWLVGWKTKWKVGAAAGWQYQSLPLPAGCHVISHCTQLSHSHYCHWPLPPAAGHCWWWLATAFIVSLFTYTYYYIGFSLIIAATLVSFHAIIRYLAPLLLPFHYIGYFRHVFVGHFHMPLLTLLRYYAISRHYYQPPVAWICQSHHCWILPLAITW